MSARDVIAAQIIHDYAVGHTWDSEACNYETDVDYSCKHLTLECARAVLAALGEPEAKEANDG